MSRENRVGRPPPQGQAERLASRVGNLEKQAEPWRTIRSDSAGALKIVAGSFLSTYHISGNQNNNILAGEGFTLTWNSVGSCTVAFSTPYRTTPIVVAMAADTPSVQWNFAAGPSGGPNTSNVTLYVVGADGNPHDARVNFIAVGVA